MLDVIWVRWVFAGSRGLILMHRHSVCCTLPCFLLKKRTLYRICTAWTNLQCIRHRKILTFWPQNSFCNALNHAFLLKKLTLHCVCTAWSALQCIWHWKCCLFMLKTYFAMLLCLQGSRKVQGYAQHAVLTWNASSTAMRLQLALSFLIRATRWRVNRCIDTLD